jgi:hypothetical protein
MRYPSNFNKLFFAQTFQPPEVLETFYHK